MYASHRHISSYKIRENFRKCSVTQLVETTETYRRVLKQKLNMKTTVIMIIVIFFIAASSYNQDKNTLYVMTLRDRHKEICIDESGINSEDTKLIKPYGFGPKVDESLKCYVGCLLKKNNITTENGDLRVEKITKTMPIKVKRNVVTYMAECQSDVKNNDCKRSGNQLGCIDSKMQKDELGRIWFMYD